MTVPVTPDVELIDQRPRLAEIRDEVTEGLSRSRKSLPPKLFYDGRGSELFLQITALPEYYLTRAELEILQRHAAEITAGWKTGYVLIELGSGSSDKVRILLDRVTEPITYMPIDISRLHLREAALAIGRDYPRIRVIAVCSDYTTGLDIPEWEVWKRRIFFFPGSTIGNMEPKDARAFLTRMASSQATGDGMIIGVDLKKDPARLHAAYNDAEGITAEFNRNILKRINRELGADFRVERFEHLAFYNQDLGRIEMHLRSLDDQTVTIGASSFEFRRGETIHTESSYKYGLADFEALIDGTGFRIARTWTDREQHFSVHDLVVV